MGSPVLGIDLGTTNSVVAVCEEGQPRVLADDNGQALQPSVVSFHPSGRVLTGQQARERRLLDAANTIFSVKRLIGRPFRVSEVQRAAQRLPFSLIESPTGAVMVEARGERYTLPEISALVLRRMRGIAEQALGQSCVNAVVTVPANFNELQRTATRDAGRIAGLNVLRILNEPTAAALAYGYRERTDERVAVYDLGGGTFDMSILDLSGDVIEVIATAGDSYLGGDDIDASIADRMVAEFLAAHRVDLGRDTQGYERLRLAAEWVKCELSQRDRAKVRVQDVAYGRDGRTLDLEFSMSRAELDQLTFPLVGRTFDICQAALRTAGVAPTQLDNVIMVGGQTRSPKVREMVAEYFGRPPLTRVDPSLVVAEGAAVQGLVIGGGQLERPSPPSSRPAPPLGPFDDEPTRVRRDPAQELGFDEEPTRVRGDAAEFDLDEEPTEVAPRRVPPPSRAPAPSRAKPIGAVTLRSMTSGPPSSAPGRASSPPPRSASSPAPPPVPADVLPPAPPPAVGSTPPPIAGRAQRPGSDTLPEAEPPAFDEPPTAEPPDAVEPAPPSGIDVPVSLPPVASERELAAESATDVEGIGALDEPPVEEQEAPPARPVPGPPPATGEPATTIPPATQRPVPLLLDVTPSALAIETAGGYCEQVIEQNAPVPTEQSRRFTTSMDGQSQVRVRVCQGQERRVQDNQELGHIELSNLHPAPRGHVKIDVTFMLDEGGMLDVRAEDRATGKAQEIRIDLVGALSDAEIERMKRRQADMTVVE
ncbi:MAG: Hsp70 family protein [Myxococcales bacterium]|jgi:molecular chaperone DnaK